MEIYVEVFTAHLKLEQTHLLQPDVCDGAVESILAARTSWGFRILRFFTVFNCHLEFFGVHQISL